MAEVRHYLGLRRFRGQTPWARAFAAFLAAGFGQFSLGPASAAPSELSGVASDLADAAVASPEIEFVDHVDREEVPDDSISANADVSMGRSNSVPSREPGFGSPGSELIARLDHDQPEWSSKSLGFDKTIVGRNLRSRLGRTIPDAIARLTHDPDFEDDSFLSLSQETSRRATVSASWFVSEFVNGMHESFLDDTDSLLDEDLVLNGSRLFGRRWGIQSDTFVDRGGMDQMTAEERLVFRSGVEAMKETISQTDAYQFLYRRLQDVEVYLNWSLVHAEQDFAHVVKLYSADEEEDKGSKVSVNSSDIVSKVDSRFRLANLVERPAEIFELRGKVLRNLHFSYYPMNQRLEISTVLFRSRGYRIGLTYTESGSERMLVAGLTAGF